MSEAKSKDQELESKTESRFETTFKSCFEAYNAWSEDQLNREKRNGLVEAIHDIRRVIARLEIEIAMSESKERASNPIPIPTHKTKQGGGKPLAVPSDFKETRRKNLEEAEKREEEAKAKREQRKSRSRKRPSDDNKSKGDDNGPLPGFLTQDTETGEKEEGKKKPTKRSAPRKPRAKKSDD